MCNKNNEMLPDMFSDILKSENFKYFEISEYPVYIYIAPYPLLSHEHKP